MFYVIFLKVNNLCNEQQPYMYALNGNAEPQFVP